VYKPAPPVRPPVVNVRYDDTYEDLYMRPWWATSTKFNPNYKIGTLNSLEHNDENKGFTIEEALKFPQEIKDKYNIDYIFNQLKEKNGWHNQ
jgi:hypothetical protein